MKFKRNMKKSEQVPEYHFINETGTPKIEIEHVRNVYDNIANQWNNTRYKPWPSIKKFLETEAKKYDLVIEIGCGNGKNLQLSLEYTKSPIIIANDVSMPLCNIASRQTPESDIHSADIVSIPIRSSMFDIVMCIAVLHHLSTIDRRQTAVNECARILVPGGKVIFYAWSQDQNDGQSGHLFESQEVFVPFHKKTYIKEDVNTIIDHATYDESNSSIVLKRYCHVFIPGELEELVTKSGLVIIKSFQDSGNICVTAKKI